MPDTETEELKITFVVEDGTCVPGANSYITLEEAGQYQRNKGREDWLALSDDEKLSSLIKGTQYVNDLYKWKGRRKFESQALAFPRVDPRDFQGYVRDLDGFPVKGIPKKLKDAVCEAAFFGYKATEELFNVVREGTGNLKREKKVISGAVEKEVEYFDSGSSVTEYISKYAAIDSLLKGLYIDPKQKDVNHRACWCF